MVQRNIMIFFRNLKKLNDEIFLFAAYLFQFVSHNIKERKLKKY